MRHRTLGVKSLTEADRWKITFMRVTTTVAHLRSLAAPAQQPDSARVAPTELATFSIHAVLIGWQFDADRDIHLVIADPGAPSKAMIAEVPSTTCDHACSSGHPARAVTEG
jgi:hypothetical protein